MARDMTDKEIMKMELDQLKVEENTPRTPISGNAQELLDYVEGLSADDPLVKGVSEEKNPYKGGSGGGCVIT